MNNKKVRTILGDIDAEKMGFTYPHEHLYTYPPKHQKDRDLELSEYDSSVKELLNFKDAGGKTLVEATTLDYGRNASIVKKMAKNTNVNVVMCTGFNKQMYYPNWVYEMNKQQIGQVLSNDINKGMDNTDAKAGYLKAGSSYNYLHPVEEKTTRAIAYVSNETGASIWVHTEAGTMGIEMVDLLLSEGVDPKKIVIGHSDRNADLNYHLKLAKKGVYVQYDGPGKIKYYPDSVRVQLIKGMIKNGYEKQLLISGDMGRASYLHGYGGGPGFRFIIKKFIPRLLEEGISQASIDRIFIENPASWLAQF